ncbi:hypothetical protein [Mucilaginibacter sp.]|uniref:hypothetical protein n=1 Tax=Mucilaginibacter sp. TaxID=1882438 RepID=UPI003263DAFF
MTNIRFNKINPALFTRIQPIANTPPDTATVSAAIARLNTRIAFQEVADVPRVDYIMPAEVAVTGPILDDGATTVFQDVHGNGQWLLPTFTKKDALQGGFNFTCIKNGKTSDSAGNIIDNYTGTVTINLDTNLPAPDQDVTVAGDKVLPLNNITAVLNFKLANGQVLTYQPVVAIAGTVCTLTFNADDLGVLTKLYTILSDPTSSPFCTLVIQGTYWGFRKKEAPQKLIKFRNFVQLNRGITFKPRFKPLEVQPAFSVNRRILKTLEPFETPEITDLPDPYVAPENNTPTEPEPEPYVEPEINNTPEPEPEVIPQDDAPKYEQVGNVPYLTIIPVSFDCATYPNNYIVTDGDSQTVFGCNPPFDTSIVRKHTYAPFSILTGSLSEQHYGINAIYRNQLNNNYLIVPEQYLIVLEDPSDTGQLVPSAYLNTTVDFNDADGISKSTANFKFNVAPNLSAWQVRKIKELIVKNLPQNLGKTVNDIYIEYPQVLDNAQDQQLFNGHNIPVVEAVNQGTATSKADSLNIFHIEFKQVPIHDGTAATIAGLLKATAGGLVDKLVWKVDTPADIVVQSAVKLSLFTVTGDALRYMVDVANDAKYLSNNSLYDVIINSYINNGTSADVTPAALIEGNNTVATSALSFGPAITNVSDLNYAYKANDDYVKQVLKELRFNADEVDDSIIVTNNTGLFAKHNIKQIDFNISITKSGDTDPANVLTSATKSITEDGAINHIPFILPVANYLSNWSAIYYTVISFTDGTAQLATDPVLIDDINRIGKVINLTATSLGLN